MIKLTSAVIASLLALSSAAFAQTYPDRPVTIVVGFGPGGPDTNARLLAAQLSEQTGGTFVVENKPGAGSLIGTETVVRAEPDGYTLLMTSAALATLPALQKSLPFDPLTDLIPISLIARTEASFIVASPTLPVTSLEELLTYSKDHTVAYASSGIGASSHLRMAVFAAANELPLTHIPFKSTGESMASVINGETQLLFVTSSQAVPYITEGKVNALAYDNEARAEFLPDVPTIIEAGAKPTNMDSGWNGLLAPAGTPPEVVAWLEREVQIAIQDPEVQATLIGLGLEPVGSSGAEFAEALKVSVAGMAAAVEAAGIEAQ